MRILFNKKYLWIVLLIYMQQLYALNINELKKIQGTNPTPKELNSYILNKCKEYNIPPIIVKSILLKEGLQGYKWKQYSPENGYNYDTIVYHPDKDKNGKIISYGLGLFQITYPVDNNHNFTGNESEIRKVVSSWRYNVDKAFSKLQAKWKKNIGNFKGPDVNPAIIENWFYPIAWYNGSGIYAKKYVDDAYKIMKDKNYAYKYLESTENSYEIEPYYTEIPSISEPYIIPSFNISSISASHPQAYSLKQIYDNGGELHIWNKKSNTYSVFDFNSEPSSTVNNGKFTSFDLSIYEPETFKMKEEYPYTNFWAHKYWKVNGHYVTHTGCDFRVTKSHNVVKSYGFGKITNHKNAYGQVSIQHLVNSGEYFQINLLHSRNIDPNIVKGHYIVKNQIIGYKSNIGASGKPDNSMGAHLHVEVTDGVSLSWVYTNKAYPGVGNTHPSKYSKGGLLAHYSSDNIYKRYYNPREFASKKSEAIPFLSYRNASPTEENYDVYGIENQPLYGYLNLSGKFDNSAIVVRNFFNRNNISDKGGLSDSLRFLGGLQKNPSGIYGNALYPKGDYLFVAYVDHNGENRFGYPVKFSVLSAGSIIVDNDQQNADSDSSNDSQNEPAYNATKGSKIPGYFLTADLVNGRSNAWAQWKPYKKGKYKIYVHVPEYGATATDVKYILKPDGTNQHIVVFTAVDQASNAGQWVQLVSENGDNEFSLEKLGYVGLYLGKDTNNLNYSVTSDQKVALDAVKFEAITSNDTPLPDFQVDQDGFFDMEQYPSTITKLRKVIDAFRDKKVIPQTSSNPDKWTNANENELASVAYELNNKINSNAALFKGRKYNGYVYYLVKTEEPNIFFLYFADMDENMEKVFQSYGLGKNSVLMIAVTNGQVVPYLGSVVYK